MANNAIANLHRALRPREQVVRKDHSRNSSYTARLHPMYARSLMHASDATNERLIQANAENSYQVSMDDLPLSCPMPGMKLWNSHPRVYLPIETSGHAKCPYCGAVYTLVDQH